MAGPLNPAFWLNLAAKRALPVEGGLTHQAWINRAGNPERLGVTAAEAQTAHPDLATLRVSPKAIDITNLAPGPLTDIQLRRMNELLLELGLPERGAVRIGDSAGRGYRAPSLMELLGSDKVRSLEEFCGGGPVKMAGGGALGKAARALGFRIPVYHGTRTGVMEGDALRGASSARRVDTHLGPHVAVDPRVADAFATKFYAQRPGESIGPEDLVGRTNYGRRNAVKTLPGGNILPLALRGEFKNLPTDSQFGSGGLGSDILKMAVEDPERHREYIRNWLKQSSHGWLENKNLDSVIENLLAGREAPIGVTTKGSGRFYVPVERMAELQKLGQPLTAKEIGLSSFEQLIANNPNKSLTSPLALNETELAANKLIADDYKRRLAEEGFSGVQYLNRSVKEVPPGLGYDPTSFIVTDPTALRSMFAKFRAEDIDKIGLGLKQGGLVRIKEARYG